MLLVQELPAENELSACLSQPQRASTVHLVPGWEYLGPLAQEHTRACLEQQPSHPAHGTLESGVPEWGWGYRVPVFLQPIVFTTLSVGLGLKFLFEERVLLLKINKYTNI